MPINDSITRRYWAHVIQRGKDECWGWSASKNNKGYGRLNSGMGMNRTALAHRVSWEIHFGDPGDLLICHKCDNRECTNPSHLFLGTQSDNLKDMSSKGRGGGYRFPRKNVPGNAKLNQDLANKIRDLCLSSGLSQEAIGKQFGVSQAVVSLISLNKIWTRT